MIVAILWILVAIAAGLLLGSAIRAVAEDMPTGCTHDCNQGRNCTCTAAQEIAQ